MPINVRPFVPSRLTRRPGHESGRIPTSALAGYIALTKPRIIELLLITTIPTMVVANNGWPSLWLMVAAGAAQGEAGRCVFSDRVMQTTVSAFRFG